MITKSMIIQLHELSINKYGGSKGIRDIGLMESAIARPYQTFGGLDLYPSVFEKAAALAESIIINHPFVDGNKRTGYLAMLAILENEHTFLNASNDELYNLVIEISTGQIRFDQIVVWLKENSSPA
jgi:death-on-curing protein